MNNWVDRGVIIEQNNLKVFIWVKGHSKAGQSFIHIVISFLNVV